MIHLNKEFYANLAQELTTQICDNGYNDGVIELAIPHPVNSSKVEIVFAFNSADYTLQHGISSLSYLLLAFNGGVRCSTDFEVEKLESEID